MSTYLYLVQRRGNNMEKFFNLDNPLFQALNKIIDTVVLSLIYTLFLAPATFMGYVIINEGFYLLFILLFVITMALVGPATTALYYAMVKVIRRERGYALSEFFRSFKLNFRQGAIIGMIFGLLIGLLYFDYKFVNEANKEDASTLNTIMLIGFNAVVILMVLVSTYIFPLLSRFTLPIKNFFKNALFMSIRHLPSTLLMILINFAGIFIVWWFFPLPFFFVIPGGCILLDSLLMEKIFKRYMPEAEGNPEETGVDEWYRE